MSQAEGVSGEPRMKTIETKVPSRLDRLPWSGFHRTVVVGLGAVWILDGLEVTMVGSVASRMTEHGTGIAITAGQISIAAALYVAGACCGALFFGHLTDKYGRRRLFMLTLGVYLVATTATAFSVWPWFFYLFRFITGAGIGGEYSAINSAIDELIPARVRGRVDLMINGSYWLGSAGGSALALLFLDEGIFPAWLGWRLAFGVGAVLALGILLIRRNVPESPRWLFIHGREEEAEALVSDIEQGVEEETGESLPEVDDDATLTVRQRDTISFREIARTAFKRYPRRAILGFSLFVGQAFLYNGVTFNLGTILSNAFHVASGTVPVFIILFAVGNFLGPLLLGRLFDTIGRKPMISGTYLASSAVAIFLGVLFVSTTGILGRWTFIAIVIGIFFLASAGASAAYLTVSEIFPMETRALAIAFFYAIGTAVGGITGPLIFGHLEGSALKLAIAFWIGAGVMAIGGIVEIFFGVKAEQRSLEDIAEPLTAEEAERGSEGARTDGEAGASRDGDEPEPGPERTAARHAREQAAEHRAAAAEHRAVAHEQQASAAEGNGRAEDRARVELVLAEIAELRARACDEHAAAADERADAEGRDEGEAEAARDRARAAEERALAEEQKAEALGAEDESSAHRYRALADAALERARANEQRAQAEAALAELGGDGDIDPASEVQRARAEMHEAWAEFHSARAQAAERRAERDDAGEAETTRRAEALEELGRAAAYRVEAAERRAEAEGERRAETTASDVGRRREAEERRARAREREQRLRERIERRRAHERQGLRRYRPGPGRTMSSRGWPASTDVPEAYELDHEVAAIARALEERGPTARGELARAVGARYWGPGVFGQALREAVSEGRIRRLARGTFGPS